MCCFLNLYICTFSIFIYNISRSWVFCLKKFSWRLEQFQMIKAFTRELWKTFFVEISLLLSKTFSWFVPLLHQILSARFFYSIWPNGKSKTYEVFAFNWLRILNIKYVNMMQSKTIQWMANRFVKYNPCKFNQMRTNPMMSRL